MSKQIDNLLDSLIKEIDAKDGHPAPKEPKPVSAEARGRAEAIAKGVNKSYRRPPEPVKQSIPAPRIKPVVEPDPVSHFTEEPSMDPAIRMHDRLDESTLPAPDAERRPTQIMDIDGGNRKRRKRRTSGARSIPAPPEAPKRKIPHINVPDELPPDVANEPYQAPAAPEPDAEREALVRSRAEKIREQLKQRTLEETPIIPPPSAEEIDDMLSDLEQPEPSEEPLSREDDNIFAYLHQVLGVEDEPEVPEEIEETEEPAVSAADRPRWFDDAPAPMPLQHTGADDDDEYDEYDEYDDDELSGDALSGETSARSRLRHLDAGDEIKEKRENPIAAFFKNLFGRKNAENASEEDAFDEEDFEENEPEDYGSDENLYEEDAAEEVSDDFGYEEIAAETSADEVPAVEGEEALVPPIPSPVVPELPEPGSELSESSEEDDFSEEDDEDLYEDLTEDAEEDDFEEDNPAPKQHSSFFREAFDESAEELAEIKAEPVPQPGAESSVKNRFLGRNSYFVAGVLVFVLALIGLITVISGIAKAAGMFFGGGSLKNQLEKTLYPVAVVDVAPFNEPAELTADGALSAAIVDILMYDDLSGYTETFDMIAVPADDVLERGRQMFGVDVQTQLSTLHAAGESFVYDETTGCYNVPTAPMIFSYAPEVTDVKRSGDAYEVTIVYNSDVADWQEHSRNFTEGNTKTMQATIEKKKDRYRIIRLVPAE